MELLLCHQTAKVDSITTACRGGFGLVDTECGTRRFYCSSSYDTEDMSREWYCGGKAVAAAPVRLVRLWPDHFSSRPVTQTRQWHLFLVLVLGLPLILHTSQGLFFPKTAVWMLREHFLIAKSTCEKISRASRRQISTSHLCKHTECLRALPLVVRYYCEPYHLFYATAAPVRHAVLRMFPCSQDNQLLTTTAQQGNPYLTSPLESTVTC